MERISSSVYDPSADDELTEQLEHVHLCSYHRKKYRRYREKIRKHQLTNNNTDKYVY